MSDQCADNSHNDAEDSVHQTSSELVPASRPHADDVQIDGPGSKDIVLQRLTPQSSHDRVFGDKLLFDEKAFEEALREPAPAKGRVWGALPMAAVIAIAAMAGALSGGGVTFGLMHYAKDDQVSVALAKHDRSIDESMAKLNADLAAAKVNLEAAAKANNTKLTKLGETVDKLKAAPDVTGSISSTPPAAAPAAPAPQFNRLPIVDGWALREVADGGAVVEGRMGVYEVFAGDPLPGVGRVDAIRRQDGQWVVVTSRGLIVAR